MKKYFISMACMLIALVSCQKNGTVEQTPEANQPIKVTLTATIGGDDTKVSFVDEDNVLKTAWEVGDKLSLLSVDAGGNLLANDIFEANAAGKTTEFEGEFSNSPNTAAVHVYYPALTEGEGLSTDDSKKWHSPSTTSTDVYGALNGAYLGASYIRFGCSMLQKTNGGLDHLSDYIVLQGVADKSELLSGDLSTTLKHRSYVLKATFTLPEEDLKITNNVTMSCKSADGTEDIEVTGLGWTDIGNTIDFPGGSSSFYNVGFGDDLVSGSGTGLTIEGNELIVYYIGYAGKRNGNDIAVSTGDYLNITTTVENASEWYNCGAKYTFTKDTVFENGKMYRLSATLEKQ